MLIKSKYFYILIYIIFIRALLQGYDIQLIRKKYSSKKVSASVIPLFRGIAIVTHQNKPNTVEECTNLLLQPNFLSLMNSLKLNNIKYSNNDYSQLIITIKQIHNNKIFNIAEFSTLVKWLESMEKILYYYINHYESAYKRGEDTETKNMNVIKEKVKELIKHIEDGEDYQSDLLSLKPLVT